MSFDYWHTADPDAVGSTDSSEPPDAGLYDVALVDGSAFLSKKQEAWVTLEFRVISAVARDHQWTNMLGFRSQNAANFAKRELRNLGVNTEVDSLDALDAEIKQKLGQYFTVEVKQNGEYRNTYIQETGPVAPDIPIPELGTPADAAATPDDRVPF